MERVDLRMAAAGLIQTVRAAIKAGDWKVDGACDPELDIQRVRQALAQENFTKTVRFDLSPAMREGEIHDKLIDLGWTPPNAGKGKQENEALAQPKQEAFTLDRGCWERGCCAYDERDGDGVTVLAERVDETAKRGHEPDEFCNGMPAYEGSLSKSQALSQLEQEPVAWILERPAYYALPKREWVGLTDDELPEGATYEFDRGVRWAEAKLKEKNYD